MLYQSRAGDEGFPPSFRQVQFSYRLSDVA